MLGTSLTRGTFHKLPDDVPFLIKKKSITWRRLASLSALQCPSIACCKLLRQCQSFWSKKKVVFSLSKKNWLNYSQVACYWTIMFAKNSFSTYSCSCAIFAVGDTKFLHGSGPLSPSQPDHQANLRAGIHPKSTISWMGSAELGKVCFTQKNPGETSCPWNKPNDGLRLRLLLGLHGTFIEDDHHPRRHSFHCVALPKGWQLRSEADTDESESPIVGFCTKLFIQLMERHDLWIFKVLLLCKWWQLSLAHGFAIVFAIPSDGLFLGPTFFGSSKWKKGTISIGDTSSNQHFSEANC